MAVVLAGATMALGVGAAPALAGDNVVKVRDACDPETFNAVLGDGACARDSGGKRVSFDEFVEEAADGGDDAWRFTEKIKIREGESVVARFDRGGEFHTFTEVAGLNGPGCVPDVNGLLPPLPGPAPADCSEGAFISTAVAPIPGLTERRVDGLDEGEHVFRCLIHPWMETTVQVR